MFSRLEEVPSAVSATFMALAIDLPPLPKLLLSDPPVAAHQQTHSFMTEVRVRKYHPATRSKELELVQKSTAGPAQGPGGILVSGVGGATAAWTSGGSRWCSHGLPVGCGSLQVSRILPHTYQLKSDDPSSVRPGTKSCDQ